MTIDWQQSIEDYLKQRNDLHIIKPIQPNEFRASSISGCIRHCLKLRLNLDKPSGDTLRHFHLGTSMHRFLQGEIAVGFIHEPAEFEKKVGFEQDGISFRGTIDCVTSDEIWDFKTTSNLKISTSYPTTPAYLYQLAVYKEAMLRQGKPCKTSILYIDKRNLQVFPKEVVTPPFEEVVSFCKKVMDAEIAFRNTGILPPKDACFSCMQESRPR